MYIEDLIEKVIYQNYDTELINREVIIEAKKNDINNMECAVKTVVIANGEVHITIESNDEEPVYIMQPMVETSEYPEEVLSTYYNIPDIVHGKEINYNIDIGFSSVEIFIKFNL